jgi:hypothetical protein
VLGALVALRVLRRLRFDDRLERVRDSLILTLVNRRRVRHGGW